MIAILIVLNPKILYATGFWKAKINHFANLNRNRSNNCGDIVIFWFYKTVAGRHPVFLNSGNLISRYGQTSSKSVKWLRGYRNFSIFRTAANGHVGFVNSGNLKDHQRTEGRDASLCQISSKSVKWLLGYHSFSISQHGGQLLSWIFNFQKS